MAPAPAILDIDGTLVDSNYQHAVAWFRALRRHGRVVPIWRIHRHIGMGGDQIVPALAGAEFEARHGDDARASESELFAELIDEIEPLPGAHELIRELHEGGHPIVLASSAKHEEAERYIKLLAVDGLIDSFTTSADVAHTKPQPDIVVVALQKIGADGDEARTRAVMIGDSVWDCESARRAGIASIGLRSGGFGTGELRDAGAAVVLRDAEELRRELGKTPLSS